MPALTEVMTDSKVHATKPKGHAQKALAEGCRAQVERWEREQADQAAQERRLKYAGEASKREKAKEEAQKLTTMKKLIHAAGEEPGKPAMQKLGARQSEVL